MPSLFSYLTQTRTGQEIVNVPSVVHIFVLGILLDSYPPPSPLPPRIFGIFTLAKNWKVILGAQSLAGKILMSKNLAAESQPSREECSFLTEGLGLVDDGSVEIEGQGCSSQGRLWKKAMLGYCVPEGLPKIARQFHWRVAVVDLESRAGGTTENAVVGFRRPAGTRFCLWSRHPALKTPGYCQMSLTGHGRKVPVRKSREGRAPGPRRDAPAPEGRHKIAQDGSPG